MEDTTFSDQLGDLLHKNDFLHLSSFLKEDCNQKSIHHEGMNIVSTICISLKENEDLLKDPSNYELCSDIFNTLVEKGNPKEVLIALLEAADSFKEEELFQLLLPPIQRALLLVPGKRGKSLEWVLSVLNAHISLLPLPENQDLEGEELLLLDLDPNVQRTAESLRGYLKFLDPFIKEVSHSYVKSIPYSDRVGFQQEIIQNYLLHVFNHPLVYHDLHFQSDKQQSSLQHCCLTLLTYLSNISRNFFTLLNSPPPKLNPNVADSDEENEAEKDCVPVLAHANLAYLLFAEQLCPELCPSVYSYCYLFEKMLHLIIALLERKDYLVIYKGLHLSKALLDCIPEFSLPSSYLRENKYITFSDAVFKVAMYCPVKGYRTLAVTLFKTLIYKFTWNARYSHLMRVMNSITHSGVQGFVIDLYKNLLHSSLMEGKHNVFYGKNLHFFLKKACHLDEGTETDILENYDKIVSSLNFLRFVILCDNKDSNVTGIWDVIDALFSTYLEPLHKGIELTRGHYQLERKSLKENKTSKSDLNATVTVNGELLPNVPPNYKSEIVERALVSLDLIESIVSRIKELLNNK